MDVDAGKRVYVKTVGSGCRDVIVALTVVVAVAIDPFPRLFEAAESINDGLALGCACRRTVGVDENAFDTVIVGRGVDGVDNIVENIGRRAVIGKLCHNVERSGLFDDFPTQIEI